MKKTKEAKKPKKENQEGLNFREEPICCPFCKHENLFHADMMAKTSEGDELYEYQCYGCSLSFWY
jgi:hypothetical protein